MGASKMLIIQMIITQVVLFLPPLAVAGVKIATVTHGETVRLVLAKEV